MKFGDAITLIDERNVNGEINNLLGVSIDKAFIQSVANTIGTDMSKYKMLKRNRFACSLMQVSRDHKMPIARYTNKEAAIVSPAYVTFEVTNPNVLPEYLELWTKRPEFDREADFYAVGGVRGNMTWDELCNMQLSIPTIERQREIVNQYQTISKRIDVLQQLNDKLAVFADSLFGYYIPEALHPFELSEQKTAISNLIDVRDGTHDSPCPVDEGKLLITSKHLLPFGVERKDAYFISEKDYEKINERSKVEFGDILYSMIGTIGNASLVTDREVDFAIKNMALFRTSQVGELKYYIWQLLRSSGMKNYIETHQAGSTQSYISLSTLRSAQVPYPDQTVIDACIEKIRPIIELQIANSKEAQSLEIGRDMLLSALGS